MSFSLTKIVVAPDNHKAHKFFEDISKKKEELRKKVEVRLTEKKLISPKKS